MRAASDQSSCLDGLSSPPTGQAGGSGPRAIDRSWPGRLALGLSLGAMLALLVWSATHTDLPQFQGKAMTGRLACFPLAAAVVPVGWWLARRRLRRPVPFPYAAAVLMTLPFVVDLAGNATRLYVEVENFDDAVHAVNPVLFVAALALLLDRTGVPRWASWTMAFGLGCAGHIAWEIIEYLLLEGVGAVELDLSLRDTLTDQAWGLLGAAVGATLPLRRARRFSGGQGDA
jgi:hypothetical protein